MKREEAEKRTSFRHPVKGATLQYKTGRPCLVVNISRGGISFLSQEPLQPNSSITMRITFPEGMSPMTLKGQVCWCLPGLGRSDEYQVGVQFLAFNKKRGSNPPRLLEKLIKLEDWK
jgi:Tfp pilus assembly protein PilZ